MSSTTSTTSSSSSNKRSASEAGIEQVEQGEFKKPRQVRVWADGCFDMMHYGHANALRQAKSLGDYLVVGVHSDADILKNKGPPVMNEQERYKAVAACKWVDEVVPAAPYQTQLEVLEEHNIDFCVHGDDLVTTADGTDCYELVKKAGKFKVVPRTKGVSTTDLVGRMLLMTKQHHVQDPEDVSQNKEVNRLSLSTDAKGSPYTRLSKFVPTTNQIMQFSGSAKCPGPNDKVVYIDGTFDLFHVGHIYVLEKAKAMGDYLIVGVHDDNTANRIKGANHPIMNLHERVLSVLSCKYADEVVIGAPYKIDQQLITNQGINLVVHGSGPVDPAEDGSDPYEIPKNLGIYSDIDSGSGVTTTMIIERIMDNAKAFALRNAKKELKEVAESSNA